MENKKSSKVGKYILVLIIIVIILLGIKFFANKKNTSQNTEQNVVTNNNVATSTIVNIKGSGNEPGWYITIQGNANSAETMLVVDYGDSTFTGTLGRTWQENYDKDFQFRGDLSPSASSTIQDEKDFIVYFKKEVCTDDAGKAHDYSVDLNMHSEKEYKGCADVN